jgi:hypothetical protein
MHVSTTQHPLPNVVHASRSRSAQDHAGAQAAPLAAAVPSRRLRLRADLTIAVLSAILLPLMVVAAVRLTEEGGLARVLIAVLIAALGACAVYGSATAIQAAHRNR